MFARKRRQGDRIGKGPAGGARMLAALVAGIGVWPCWAQGPASRPAGSALLGRRGPGYARTSRVPENLLDPPRRQVVILPSQPGEVGEDPEQLSQGTQKKLRADMPLLPEGYVVASREGRILKKDRWYVVELAKVEGLPDAPPLRVLPNQWLAMLEVILSAADTPSTFVVTGRITEFLGANYLLVEDLEETSAKPVKPAGEPQAVPGADTTTQPATPREPTAEELMQRLQQHKTLRPVVLPDRTPTIGEGSQAGTADDPSAASSGRRGAAWPEEALLIDRIGRVSPGELWWTLVFEDQGRHPKDKPVRLLPNRLLETAISLSGGGSQGVVFVISGEVTLHGGTNYLLLRKVLARRDLGNFR